MVLRLLKTLLCATGGTFVLTVTLAYLLAAYIRSKGHTGTQSIGFSASFIAPYMVGLFVLLAVGFFLLFRQG